MIPCKVLSLRRDFYSKKFNLSFWTWNEIPFSPIWDNSSRKRFNLPRWRWFWAKFYRGFFFYLCPEKFSPRETIKITIIIFRNIFEEKKNTHLDSLKKLKSRGNECSRRNGIRLEFPPIVTRGKERMIVARYRECTYLPFEFRVTRAKTEGNGTTHFLNLS